MWSLFLFLAAAVGFGQTPDIHFVPTSDPLVDIMLDAAGVTSQDVVYDLGSGDGRLVIAAAKKHGARGVGVSCLCPMGVNTDLLHGSGGAGNVVKAAGTVLEPADVAEVVVAGLETETFLILPHPEVLEFFRRKGADYDRWLAGMRRLQASVAAQPTKARRHHADDGVLHTADRHRAANHARVRGEACPPEGVAQHDDGVRSTDSVLVGGKGSAERGTHAEHLEVGRARHLRLHSLGTIDAGHDECFRIVKRDRRKRRLSIAQKRELRIGPHHVDDSRWSARHAEHNAHQPIGIPKRQRTE